MKERKKYTSEFKLDAVRLIENFGETIIRDCTAARRTSQSILQVYRPVRK